MKATILGYGAWGTALAIHLHNLGNPVTLWGRSGEKAAAIAQTRENPRLPGILLPGGMEISSNPDCVLGSALVVFAVPSATLRPVAREFAPRIPPDALLVCVTKGLEADTGLTMSQVIAQETGREPVVLTGPSHAEEVSRGLPTGLLAASENQQQAEAVQDIFLCPTLRVYTSPDPMGAQLGGALKNVIALCAGICDGLGYGDNAKAMLMTRGLTETARLGRSLGARQETFAGLAGVGDLIVTCTSMHSRNRRAGILIGQGKTAHQAMEEVGAVVEGYYAASAAFRLSRSRGVSMPIIEATYRVLYEDADVALSVQNLLRRQRKAESEDVGWL